ncbi:MAG TPA: uroporphyrinogen-III synthase [Bryobacteraceae bacterium]|nr:uroporphyrinogen-III synthase [Bryobacteraceae bacterium]
MSFAGKRVLSLESRRAVETAELITRKQGEPFVAPSMREVPLERNEEAFRFAERLLAGEFDMVIFLTGVGTRHLIKVLSSRHDPETITAALRRLTVVARGPKPSAALRELSVPVHINAPEPNTWRELMQSIEGRPERRIAVQEYGKTNQELIAALKQMGAGVVSVPVYAYELPEDLGPLREAVSRLAKETFDVTMFTTSQQVVHLMQIARDMGLEEAVARGVRKSVIASIGPTTTETLIEYGFQPDLEPSHPKLGILVKETAEKASDILWKKTR